MRYSGAVDQCPSDPGACQPRRNLIPLLRRQRGTPMAYFSKKQDGIDRGGKLVADIFCAVFLATMAVASFGWLGGLAAFIVLEAALLTVDYVVPGEDGAGGAGVR